MKVTCSSQDGNKIQVIDIGPDATFGDLKAILESDFGAKKQNLVLSFNGDASIPDSETLGNQGVKDKDMIVVTVVKDAVDVSSTPGLATLDGLIPENLRGLDLAKLFAPPSARTNRTNAAKIDENYQLAMNENPESFAQVYMLYIEVEVNKTKIKAFVDSGAQTTIMSKDCAIKCNMLDMVDPRFAGVAMGVGQAKILGKVHLAPLSIGGQFYNASFSVMDQVQGVDLLIGLDLLKRYQCNIDLKNDVLHIGTTDQTVPFLTEADLPPHAKLAKN